MKISYVAMQMGVILGIPATCLMALSLIQIAPPPIAAPAVPHRMPVVMPGGPRKQPYAPPPSGSIGHGRTIIHQPLHVVAVNADKTWNRKAWVKTGGIERRHFWLMCPVDVVWHKRLFVLHRQRFFWWHHRRLFHIVWLGQGWEYVNGSTTQPTTRRSFTRVLVETVRPSDVALRVKALAVLDGLQLNADQFGSIKDTLGQIPDAGNVVDADVVDNLLQSNPNSLDTVEQLYKDFVQNNDDQVASDHARLMQLEDKQQICMDPTVIVTDDARARAKEVFGMLSASQIASYLAAQNQAVPDVSDILMAGLDDCRQLTDADFVEYSHSLAERVAVLTAGLNQDEDRLVMRKVEAMLTEARGLGDDAYAARRAQFQQDADRIEKQCDPLDLVSHAVQWDLANFLSNPQAKAMVTIRARQISVPS